MSVSKYLKCTIHRSYQSSYCIILLLLQCLRRQNSFKELICSYFLNYRTQLECFSHYHKLFKKIFEMICLLLFQNHFEFIQEFIHHQNSEHILSMELDRFVDSFLSCSPYTMTYQFLNHTFMLQLSPNSLYFYLNEPQYYSPSYISKFLVENYLFNSICYYLILRVIQEQLILEFQQVKVQEHNPAILQVDSNQFQKITSKPHSAYYYFIKYLEVYSPEIT